MQNKQNKNFQNFFQWSKKKENFIECDVDAESYCLDTFYWKFLEGTSSLKRKQVQEEITTVSKKKAMLENRIQELKITQTSMLGMLKTFPK